MIDQYLQDPAAVDAPIPNPPEPGEHVKLIRKLRLDRTQASRPGGGRLVAGTKPRWVEHPGMPRGVIGEMVR